MVDGDKVLRDFLLTNSALTALVGTRVYVGPDLPKRYQPSEGPCVLLNARGGGQAYHSAVLEPSMQYRCYGRTPAEARETQRALHDALNDQAGLNVNQSRLEMYPQVLNDPDTGWPYVLCAYRHWLRNAEE